MKVVAERFNEKYRGATMCVGDQNNFLYHYRHMNANYTEISVNFPNNSQEYKVGIIKEGIVGFDEFYKLKGERMVKYDPEQQDLRASGNRKSVEVTKNQP
jgi:hypothetical protein